MNIRIATLAGTLGAFVLGSSALAAPPSSPCKVPELAKRDMKGVKVGDWQALAKKIGSDGPGANDAEAIASVCKYRGCDAATTVVCDSGDTTVCFVKDRTAAWFAFAEVIQIFEGNIEITRLASPDGRWLHVGLANEVLGRIEDAMCEDDEDGNISCVSATGSYGWEYANLVIDMKTMTLAFDGRVSDYDPTASARLRCKGKPDLTFSGDAFDYQSCDGKTAKVTLDDLGSCTVAARTAWSEAVSRAQSDAEKARSEADMAAANKKIDAGRKATAAKKYDDAVAVFDAALAISPFVAKAFSGRGYARLLREGAGDLDAAKKDFQRALEEETNDMKFRASVHFNLGLIAEKQKKPDEAKAWFKKSHGQNPSAATKKKLGIK